MRPIRALVVDDSAFNRKIISGILEALEGVTVVGKAGDGEQALRMVGSLEPDLITLDLEMPRMDGFSFLRFIMARRPIPVIVVSSHSARQDVFRALELGALDFVAKPSPSPGESLSLIRDDLIAKVELVRRLRPTSVRPPANTVSTVLKVAPVDDERPLPAEDTPEHLLVVAASTGGPSSLVEFFTWLPSDLSAAVIVVQHMPTRFTRTFAERLDRLRRLRVSEASDGDRLRAGRVLVCPGGRALEVHPAADGWAVKVLAPVPEDRYVPSADRVLRSAAAVAGSKVVGVVLTGMGEDGEQGVLAVKKAGGRVFVQSPEEAVVDGMPRAAMRHGVADAILPIAGLGERLGRELA